jgi:TetR/AcrR family transcriptional regulator, cholesterol catabolism regulator
VTNTTNGDRRARRRQQTRERVVDAAVELFVRQGYDATTVDQITAAADVARGTFFNHFSGKEALTYAWIERRREELRDRIAAITAPDAITRILEGLQSVAPLYDADETTRRVMVRTWIRCGGPFGPGHGQTAEFIRTLLDEGKKTGQFRDDLDTSVAASVFQDVFLGALCRWAASDADSLEHHLQPALDLVMPLLQR